MAGLQDSGEKDRRKVTSRIRGYKEGEITVHEGMINIETKGITCYETSSLASTMAWNGILKDTKVEY